MNLNPTISLKQSIVVLVVLALVFIVVFRDLCGVPMEPARRVTCAKNLKATFEAMNAYSSLHKGAFPIAGAFDEKNLDPVVGFDSKLARSDKPVHYSPQSLKNNATASLWLLVKDKSLTASQYVCPSTDDEMDFLTLDGKPYGKPATLAGTADFFARKHLSYSMLNMYHVQSGRNWSARSAPGWVLIGDNNDADDARELHRLTRAQKREPLDVQENENSQNHIKEGQNFMFADGSVRFELSPFFGPQADNVFADDTAEKAGAPEEAAPPMMSTNRPQPNLMRNVVLLPLSGNNGVNLDPEGGMEEKPQPPDPAAPGAREGGGSGDSGGSSPG